MGNKSKQINEVNREIGQRIRELRCGKGLSRQALQTALEKSGLKVQRKSIRLWENGTRIVKGEYIIGLAEVLDVSCDELLTGEKPEYRYSAEATGLSPRTLDLIYKRKNTGVLDTGALDALLANAEFLDNAVKMYGKLQRCREEAAEELELLCALAETEEQRAAVLSLPLSDCNSPELESAVSEAYPQEYDNLMAAYDCVDLSEYLFMRAGWEAIRSDTGKVPGEDRAVTPDMRRRHRASRQNRE